MDHTTLDGVLPHAETLSALEKAHAHPEITHVKQEDIQIPLVPVAETGTDVPVLLAALP
jgi:hypothetical protein